MQIGLNLALTLEHGGAGAPTLDMTFTGTGNALDSRITFTRASTATYFDSAGVLTSAAINAPRFDYNPATLAARGLLIEEQRTNSIRNSTMQGAVAGTPGTLPTNWGLFASNGLTTSVVSTGVSGGINYIDLRINGTTTSTFYVFAFDTVAASASAGQTWTESFWCSLVSGSTSNITSVGVNLRQVGGAGNTFDFIFAPTSTLTRYASTGTLTASATGVYAALSMFFNSGVAIDITLRIGLPQLEQGAFATSVIPTTTTALTRSADVASVNTLSPWFNETEGTLFAECVTSNGTVVAGFGETFANTSYITRGASSNISIRSGGSDQAVLTAAFNATLNAINRVAYAYKANDFAATANGAAATTDISGAVPLNQLRLKLGSSTWDTTGGNNLNGYLRRITYYPRKLSSAELQAITA